MQIVRVVEAEQPGGGAAHLGDAEDLGTVPSKVILPAVFSWMKEPREQSGVWIDAGEVRAFDGIALAAGQREISQVIRAPMLLGDDVLDVERIVLLVLLMQAAVFTAVDCPLAHFGRVWASMLQAAWR